MVRQHIVHLVSSGVRRLPEFRRKLREFVVNELFQGRSAPPQTDARYWPLPRTVLNVAYNASLQLRLVISSVTLLISSSLCPTVCVMHT